MVITRIIVLMLFSNAAIAAPPMFEKMSAFCGVPAKLLYAVALTESLNSPWTLNIGGRGVYYDTREKMFDELMAAISGDEHVDVGLMQLNWHWKNIYTDSPWLLTDPTYNLNIACRIINDHYQRSPEKGWLYAAGMYHVESMKPKYVRARNRYIQKVKSQWKKL